MGCSSEIAHRGSDCPCRSPGRVQALYVPGSRYVTGTHKDTLLTSVTVG